MDVAEPQTTAKNIRQLIDHLQEPVVLKNVLDWDILSWDLAKWEQVLGQEKLAFRRGKNAYTEKPQWERTTSTAEMKFEDFLKIDKGESDWTYFDYKYLREWFANIGELRQAISWNCVGLPELSADDSTIWIGSKGAHTPCHIDTYGCNLIAQIHGRKQWLVCPPTENLKPTRVPYEESSIYSKLNFFSPNSITHFEGIRNCRRVVLSPGDILFLPAKWWHYVENLETAISINVWLPLDDDDEHRLSEALVQLLITQLAKEVSVDTQRAILNPNSDKDSRIDLRSLIDLVYICKDIHEQNSKVGSSAMADRSMQLLDKLVLSGTVWKIPILSQSELFTFLKNQSARFPNRPLTEDSCDNPQTVKVVKLVEAITHPDVIGLIKNLFLK